MKNQMNEDNIRVAAYYIWEQAGRPEGKEKECWIKACEQLFAAGANNDCCCDDDCCTPKSTKCKSSSKSTKSCSSKTSTKSSTKSASASSVAKAAKACASRIKKSLA